MSVSVIDRTQLEDCPDSSCFQSTLPHRSQSVHDDDVQPTEYVIEDDNYYDMNHEHRGITLIFNHITFAKNLNLNRRHGTEIDCDRAKRMFEQLHFDVRVHQDLDRTELLTVLKNVASLDHTHNDCLIILVMTHGYVDTLYARNDSYSCSKLWSPFDGNNCPSLIGKPKLFFIQACRGNGFDEGVQVIVHAHSASLSGDSIDGPAPQITFTIPSQADRLVMYATYDGYVSFRSPTEGSWFVQSLCREFEKRGHIDDILQLLTRVSRMIAFHYKSMAPGNELVHDKKQIPTIVSMLTKTMYFTPKNHHIMNSK